MTSKVCFPLHLWGHRRLIWRLATTQLRDRYASTAIGSLWAILQPVMMILVFWFVFSFGLRLGRGADEAPFVLVLIIGLVAWFAFSDALLNGVNSVMQNAYLIKKIAFPVEVLPLVPVVVALIVHAALLVIVIGIMMATGTEPSVRTPLLIYYVLAMSLFATGFSYLLSAINVFQRDIGQSLAVVLNIWFWVTPIIWSPTLFPENVRGILKLNPMHYIVDGYRHALLPIGAPPPGIVETVSFWSATVVVLVAGIWLFRRVQADFADVL